MTIECQICSGEGSIYASRHGGNDPDVYRVGPCEECGGSGSEMCASKGCGNHSVVTNDDGYHLCDGCFTDWLAELVEDELTRLQ